MRGGDRADLSETALRIYLLLVREGRPMSIREIQRTLGLSSPGQVYHHLERLRDLGLVIKDSGGYRAVKRNGIVEGAIILWSSVLPRSAFYLGFSATLTIAYAITVILGLVRLDPMAIVALTSLMVFSTIEFRSQYVRLRRLLRISGDEEPSS
ncbi:helix-turn-helix domain-containing protein [Vulcanisaeta sp. JCM 14467]